jgi:hypothetical protein
MFFTSMLTRVDRWRRTAEIWSRKQGPNESVDDYVAAMQSAASRVNMPEDYLADATLQVLKPELRLFVLYAGVETIPEILKIARTSEAAHSADKSTTTTSDISKLDFVMQQQAETMKTLKLMEETNKCSNIMSDQLALSKRVTFAQATKSENDQRNDRRYSRRESPARSVSPSERNSDTRSNYARSQSPIRYGSSANINMSNDGRTSDQRRDARNVGANRQVWRPQHTKTDAIIGAMTLQLAKLMQEYHGRGERIAGRLGMVETWGRIRQWNIFFYNELNVLLYGYLFIRA